MEGVVSTDIDEKRNRIVITTDVNDVNAASLVKLKLESLTVPREAVIIEDGEPIGTASEPVPKPLPQPVPSAILTNEALILIVVIILIALCIIYYKRRK